jgi:hypothetical protein
MQRDAGRNHRPDRLRHARAAGTQVVLPGLIGAASAASTEVKRAVDSASQSQKPDVPLACSSSPIRRRSGRSALLKPRCCRCRHPAAVRNRCADTKAKRCFANAARPECARRFPRLWFGPGREFSRRRVGIGIVRRDRLHGLRRAAPVVAVKTESALRINSVFAHGPKIKLNFGLGSNVADVPELAGLVEGW